MGALFRTAVFIFGVAVVLIGAELIRENRTLYSRKYGTETPSYVTGAVVATFGAILIAGAFHPGRGKRKP